MSNDAGGGQSPSSPPFSICHLVFAIAVCLALLAASGCSLFAPRKPLLYRVQGRVVDADTRQPAANVRVRLAARIPTDFGPRTLTAYGMTGHDGTYDIELSEGFAVLRSAQAIRIEVSKGGFGATAIDLPIPAKRESVYKAPDLYLAPVVRGDTAVPRTRSPEKPIPWQ
jgi:hypothetical protein